MTQSLKSLRRLAHVRELLRDQAAAELQKAHSRESLQASELRQVTENLKLAQRSADTTLTNARSVSDLEQASVGLIAARTIIEATSQLVRQAERVTAAAQAIARNRAVDFKIATTRVERAQKQRAVQQEKAEQSLHDELVHFSAESEP